MRKLAGFILLEVLLAVVIIATALSAHMGLMARSLAITSACERSTKAIVVFEELLFKLETGQRDDLLRYDGKEPIDGEYVFEMKTKMAADSFCWLSGKLMSAKGSWLDIEAYFPEAS